MNNRDSSSFWPIPCGTWFATNVRVSALLPLLVLVLCWRLDDVRLGLVFSGIFFVSLVAHEFGHVVAARMTGGAGDEILIWPFGGLAMVRPAGSFRSELLTPAGGPLVNFILCGVTLRAVLDWVDLNPGSSHAAFDPLQMPLGELSENLLSDVLVLTFVANWILLLVNLLPVYPMDGGQILQTCLRSWWGGPAGTEIYIRVGFVVGVVGVFAGLMLDHTGVVLLGAIIVLLNMREMYQLRTADGYGDSFMGYDFSQGYTSLERGQEKTSQRRPGLLHRWRERRRAEKLRRDKQRDIEVGSMLDAILEKVHRTGIESLTVAEKRLLNRASTRFREKDRDGR